MDARRPPQGPAAHFPRRRGRRQLAEAGRALLEHARDAGSMDAFPARARMRAEGREPTLAVAVDVMLPIARLTAAVTAFHHT